jgi:hypothetical protein
MSYVNYKADVVIRYGVILEGWPEGIDFACPSKLGNNISILNRLKDAVVSGNCKFRALSTAEHRRFREEYDQQVASGELVIPSRKTRKDAGKKHTREVLSATDSEGESEALHTSDPKSTQPISARAGKRSLTKKPRYAEPANENTESSESSNDDEDDEDDFRPPSPCSAPSDLNCSAADQLGSTTSVPTGPSPSRLVDAPRFAYLHGEVPRNAQGRRLFSATPPLAHPTGKRNRVPTKVSHLGFEDQGNKENHGVASRK